MDHPRVESLAGLVSYLYRYKNQLLCLMGLKLISKFFSVVEQVFPVLHVVGFAVWQTRRCSNELSGKINQARSGKRTLPAWYQQDLEARTA